MKITNLIQFISTAAAVFVFFCLSSVSVFAQSTLTPKLDLKGAGSVDVDDMAIWHHPSNPSQSIIIGSDKSGDQLFVFDLQGKQLQKITGVGAPGNIDLTYNFPLGNQTVDLVAVNERDTDYILFYKVNPSTRQLEALASTVKASGQSYGICLYQSPRTNLFYVFINHDNNGVTEQFELSTSGSDTINGSLKRSWDIGGQTEGCVADYDNAVVYFGEEDKAVWKYGAEPTDSTSNRTAIVTSGQNNARADLEGVTLYYMNNGSGYIMISSQGNSTYQVYDRLAPHAYRGQFKINGASSTDGVDVISSSLGSAFPNGLFIAHDGKKTNSALKVVDFSDIASAVNLQMDSSWNPRGTGGTVPTTNPTTAPTTNPTSQPTVAPTTNPTTAPTTAPTDAPTPTLVPTNPGGSTPVHIGSSAGNASSTDSLTVSLPSNQSALYMVSAHMTVSNVEISSISGAGLNWQKQVHQCTARGGNGIQVWTAYGTPNGNQIEINLNREATNVTAVVSAFANVNASSPIAQVIGANTDGINGDCSGGSDTASYSVPVSSANSLLVSATSIRLRDHTPGAGMTELVEEHQGSSGEMTGVAVQTTTQSNVSGTLSSETNWTVATLVLNGGEGSPTACVGNLNNDDVVDLTDFVILTGQFLKKGSNLDADLNNDGVVDLSDFSIMKSNFTKKCAPKGKPGQTVTPTSSPTPTSTTTPRPTATPAPTPTATPRPSATPQPTVAPTATPFPTLPPISQGKGIWISREEIMALPTSGTAWNRLVSAANSNWGSANLGDNNASHDVHTLAGALVAVRTNDPAMRSKTIAGLESAMNSRLARSLELARGLQSYVLAADIIGYRTPEFENWLRKMLDADVSPHSGGSNLCNQQGTPESCKDLGGLVCTAVRAYNNWGTMARSSTIAAALYLGDDQLVNRMVNAHRSFIGESAPNNMYCENTNWHANSTNKYGVNKTGSKIQGIDVSGVLPEDWRRGEEFKWPPAPTGYMWEGMQGYVSSAAMLHRAGLVPFNAGDNSVVRAMDILYRIDNAPTSDDTWIPWLVNYYAGTNYPTSTANPGKGIGWTDWTHAR